VFGAHRTPQLLLPAKSPNLPHSLPNLAARLYSLYSCSEAMSPDQADVPKTLASPTKPGNLLGWEPTVAFPSHPESLTQKV
jgi:hypothetical protein